MKKLSIIVPCYNEKDVVLLYYNKTIEIINKITDSYSYEFIFINDGSTDNTFELLKEIKSFDENVRIINFSRNFGKESAIYAGLINSCGDLVVIMDADLQHNPEIILQMLENIELGYDVVTTIRKNRKGDPIFKSFFSKFFYKLINRIIDFKIIPGMQDFSMMKRVVVDSICSLKEYNRFSKGICSWVGFSVKYIQTINCSRKAGKTKWTYKSLFKYALEGVLSFSVSPLRISTLLGVFISCISIVSAFFIILQTLFLGKDIPGYASTITAVLFMGGIQLLSIGILAEYIAKMYLEVKARPKYIIKEKID